MNVATTTTQHKLGDTRMVAGHTQTLKSVKGGAHRWVVEGREPSHDERHAHTESKMGSVDPSLASTMAFLRNSTDYKKHGATTAGAGDRTLGKQAKLLADAIAHGKGDGPEVDLGNGKKVKSHKALGGLVVDLGGGKIGFSSEAGSLVFGKADASGKRKVTYTTNTATVRKSMQGGSETAIGKASDTTIQKRKPIEKAVEHAAAAVKHSPEVQHATAKAAETLGDPLADPKMDLLVEKVIAKLAESGLAKKPIDVSPEAIKQAAADIHAKHHAPEKIKRRKTAYDKVVDEQAKGWNMNPDDYRKVSDELHREYINHLSARMAAKEAAHQITNLSQKQIEKLNEKYDSGSKIPQTKNLDDVGRSLASQFPVLGWGRGYEGDDTGEDHTDYGAKLWDLLLEKKERKRQLAKTSPKFIDHVGEFLVKHLQPQAEREPGDDGDYEPADANRHHEESTPFKRGGKPLRYSELMKRRHERLKRRQRYSQFDPSKHPRGGFGENRGWFSQADKGTGGSGTPRSLKSTHGSIGELFDRAMADSSKNDAFIQYAHVSDAAKQRIEAATGIKLDDNYVHGIDVSGIKHAWEEHGTGHEKAHGQPPLSKSDFDTIRDVVENFDSVTTEKNSRGQDMFCYKKKYNGHVFVVEEARTGRAALMFVTMWKHKS